MRVLVIVLVLAACYEAKSVDFDSLVKTMLESERARSIVTAGGGNDVIATDDDRTRYETELRAAVERVLKPYEEDWAINVLDLPEDLFIRITNAMIQIIAGVHTECGEMLWSSYHAGRLVVELEDDTDLEMQMAHAAVQRIPNIPLSYHELLTRFTAVRQTAFEPAIHAIRTLETEHDLPIAADLWRNIYKLFSAENFVQWTTKEAISKVLDMVISWHGTNFLPICHSHKSTATTDTLQAVIDNALDKIERCLINTAFIDEMKTLGVVLDDEIKMGFNDVIAHYVESKRYILLEMVMAQPTWEYLNYLLFKFHEDYLQQRIQIAFHVRPWFFLSNYVDRDTFDKVITTVMTNGEGHNDTDSLATQYFFGVLQTLSNAGLTAEQLKSGLEMTLHTISDGDMHLR